jgi:hypothetical protein
MVWHILTHIFRVGIGGFDVLPKTSLYVFSTKLKHVLVKLLHHSDICSGSGTSTTPHSMMVTHCGLSTVFGGTLGCDHDVTTRLGAPQPRIYTGCVIYHATAVCEQRCSSSINIPFAMIRSLTNLVVTSQCSVYL